MERGASDAGELATGAVKDDEGGVGVLAGGGGVDLEAQLGGVAEQLGDRSGAQVGDGDRGQLDRLDQPRAGGRLRERLGVERGVGAVRAEARGVELDAAGEQAQGGDLVVLRVEELPADGLGDRPRSGLGVLAQERGDDDDAQGGAQPGAQGGDGVQDLAAVDLRGEDRCGVLTAEQGARVGAKAQPQLGEAVVADDAGVVGGLAQAVAADHPAERGAGDQLVLDGLDEDAAGEQVELGLAADLRAQADGAVEVALVEAHVLTKADDAGDPPGRVPEEGLAVVEDRDRGGEAAGLDHLALAVGSELASALQALGADEGAGEGVVGAADVEAVLAGEQLHAGGALAGAVAGLDDDLARLVDHQGVDADRQLAQVAEVGAIFGGEQEVEEAAERGLGDAAADVSEGDGVVVAVDLDPGRAVGDRRLDQLEDVAGGVGEGELPQLLDRLGAREGEAPPLGEAAAAAGLGDDGVDRAHRRPPRAGAAASSGRAAAIRATSRPSRRSSLSSRSLARQ